MFAGSTSASEIDFGATYTGSTYTSTAAGTAYRIEQTSNDLAILGAANLTGGHTFAGITTNFLSFHYDGASPANPSIYAYQSLIPITTSTAPTLGNSANTWGTVYAANYNTGSLAVIDSSGNVTPVSLTTGQISPLASGTSYIGSVGHGFTIFGTQYNTASGISVIDGSGDVIAQQLNASSVGTLTVGSGNVYLRGYSGVPNCSGVSDYWIGIDAANHQINICISGTTYKGDLHT